MSELIDYALPMIRLEKRLLAMHNLLLDKRMDEALESSVELVAEARLLNRVLILMKEREDALRKQTPPVQERIPTATAPQRSSKANGASKSAAGVGRQGH